MLCLEGFLSGCALRTFSYYNYNGDATSELGLKKAAGLQKGDVEGVVLVSDGLDSRE